MIVRTRFAPSPTGFLHIGSVRTALYNWLYARKHQGQFILRIEDTDRERSTTESINAILDGLDWLRLSYDEGPFYQTQRFDRYHEVIEKLLAEDKAYRCYCSKERLEALREEQLQKREKPRYDGHCRDLEKINSDQPFVIRFRNPTSGQVVVDDQVYGKIIFNNEELDDLIIARSDGMPTYNFSVVVDDWDMHITHVIRGDDHLNNTPRQINILKALNAELPVYSHLPMILGPDGKRLSKRHGAANVLAYREEGFLPEAILNYLVRLGWSYGDREIFSIDEMINFFNLQSINRSSAAFNPEKLTWLNQHYIKTCSPTYVAEPLKALMLQKNIDIAKGPPLEEVVIALRERVKTLAEMVERSQYFYEDGIQYNEAELRQFIDNATIPALETICKRFIELNSWEKNSIHQVITEVAQTFDLKLGKLAQPIRLAITGTTISPPIDITLALLGKEKTVQRLQNMLKYLTEKMPG